VAVLKVRKLVLCLTLHKIISYPSTRLNCRNILTDNRVKLIQPAALNNSITKVYYRLPNIYNAAVASVDKQSISH